MRTIKKIISVILTITVIISLLSFAVVRAADDETTIDEIVYTLDSVNCTAEVKGNVFTSAKDIVVIPAVINVEGTDYKVTSIKGSSVSSTSTAGDGAFYKANVKSVILPEGITSIGKEVFYGSSLTSINIPSTVRLNYSSDTGIFKACTKLTEVTISEGLNCIAPSMFYYCPSLTELTLPKSVSMVSENAFSRDYILKDITFLGNSLSIVNSKGTAKADFIIVGSNAWGNDKNVAENSKTKYYTVSSDVRDELIRACSGLTDEEKAANIIELDNYPVKLFYNDGVTPKESYEIDKSAGTFTLPDVIRHGYYLTGWSDGNSLYDGGEVYDLTSGVIFTAFWEKDNEPETVLYKDISSHAAVNTFGEPLCIRKIYCEDLKKSSVTAQFTDSSDTVTVKTVEFDKYGNWLNKDDDTLYKKVEFTGLSDYSKMFILTDCDDESEVTLSIKTEKNVIFPRINWVFDQSAFNWSTSDITVAKVTNGTVYGIKSGTAVITAEYEGTTYSVTVNILGEIAEAEKNGTVSEYLADKKPVIDAVNEAIKENDKAKLYAVLKSTNTEDNKNLSYINDIDTSIIDSIADNDFFDKFMDRLISYKSFKCEEIKDILYLSDVITGEIKAGYLNGLDTAEDAEEVLNENEQYYGIDLNNKYYLENKEDVLNSFVNYTVENVGKIKSDFVESYVMNAYKNELGYIGLQEKIIDMQSEIGYSLTGFDAKNKAAMYKDLLNAKDKILTVGDLKNYIDSYVYKEGTGSGGGGSTGGGGSAGGSSLIGGSLVGNKDIDVFIDNNTAKNTDDNSIPQLVPLFNDVSADRWSYASIQILVADGAVNGYEDGSFCPVNNITRAEFVKILFNAFDLIADVENSGENGTDGQEDEKEQSTKPAENAFADVPAEAWYFDAVYAAKNAGLINGDNSNRFNPDSLITREEMSAILYRLTVLKGKNFDANNAVKFADEDSISDWAYLSVMQLSKIGIINGYSDGTFKPCGNATREEAVKMIADTLLLFKA